MTSPIRPISDYEISVDARTMQLVVGPRRPTVTCEVAPPERCYHRTAPALRHDLRSAARDFRRADLGRHAPALTNAVAMMQPHNHKDRR